MAMDHHQGPSKGRGSNGDVVSSTPAVSFLQEASLHSPNEIEITNQNATSKKPLQGPVVDQPKTFRST